MNFLFLTPLAPRTRVPLFGGVGEVALVLTICHSLRCASSLPQLVVLSIQLSHRPFAKGA